MTALEFIQRGREDLRGVKGVEKSTAEQIEEMLFKSYMAMINEAMVRNNIKITGIWQHLDLADRLMTEKGYKQFIKGVKGNEN